MMTRLALNNRSGSRGFTRFEGFLLSLSLLFSTSCILHSSEYWQWQVVGAIIILWLVYFIVSWQREIYRLAFRVGIRKERAFFNL